MELGLEGERRRVLGMSRGNERVHVILYTTQKTQKVKKWQDGTLEVVRQNGKFSCKLKSEDGEELETRWRLQVCL